MLRLLIVLLAVLPAFPQSPTIGNCPVLPADNIWNTPVDQLPALTNSWVTTIGGTKLLHPDFGAGLYSGGPIGIPFITVPGTQTKYPATFTYADESDPGPYAVPLTAPIEGGSQSTGDRHAIAIDTDNCILYELYAAYPQTASWTAGSGAIYNLLSDALRPAGWTSADAAGLPIFPGLVRYDEVAAGQINHAIRFTVPQTQMAYLWPARHYASSLTGTQYPPMGARFRLKAGFDISGFSAANQVILRALKKYGMILADNGSAWYISGAPDDRWNNTDLHNLGSIAGSNFEPVDVSGMMADPNSGQAKSSTAVTVTVNPPTATVMVNGTQPFSATVTNDSSQLVNWSVNGAPGGNATVGTIGTTGFYTAPAAVPAGGSVTVQAASADTPAAIGSATVTITAPPQPPVLNSVSPSSGAQGTSVPVTLTGSNFLAGASVAVSGTGVSVSSVSVAGASRITATFTVAAGASTGARNVTVGTTAGTSGVQPFTVTLSNKPTLTNIAPNAGSRGTTAGVTLTGTNFTAPATIVASGSGVTVSNVVVVNSTTITASFKINRSTTRSTRNVTVTTAAGTSNALPFTVQ
jgi:hypothetical protein